MHSELSGFDDNGMPALIGEDFEFWSGCLGDYISVWVKNRPEFMNVQKQKIFVNALSPFMFGVSGNLPHAWINVLHSYGIIEKDRETKTTAFSGQELYMIALAVKIFICCCELADRKDDLRTIMNFIHEVEERSALTGSIDMGYALQKATDLEAFTTTWDSLKRIYRNYKSQVKVCIIYFFKIISHHIVHYGRDGLSLCDEIKIPTKKRTRTEESSHKARNKVKKGQKSGDNGFIQEALRSHTSAIRAAPFGSELYRKRALTYVQLKIYSSALSDLKRAIMLDDFVYSDVIKTKCNIQQGFINSWDFLDYIITLRARDFKNSRDIINLFENFKTGKIYKKFLALKEGDRVGHGMIQEEADTFTGEEKFNLHLREGFNAVISSQYGRAVSEYQQALDMIEKPGNEEILIQQKDLTVLMYAFGTSCIKSGSFLNLEIAIIKLNSVLGLECADNFPAVYLCLGQAYKKLNRYCKAMDVLTDGLKKTQELSEQRSNCLYYWPKSEELIPETQPETLEELIKDALQDMPMPDAYCKFHTDAANSRREIYITDPDFKGFVRLECQAKCCLAFHIACYKSYEQNLAVKHIGKEMLDMPCPTPDCCSQIRVVQMHKPENKKTLEWISSAQPALQPPRLKRKIKTENPEKLLKKMERKMLKKERKKAARMVTEYEVEELPPKEIPQPHPCLHKDEEPKHQETLDQDVKILQKGKSQVLFTGKVKHSKTKKKEKKQKQLIQLDFQFTGDDNTLRCGQNCLDHDCTLLPAMDPELTESRMPGTLQKESSRFCLEGVSDDLGRQIYKSLGRIISAGVSDLESEEFRELMVKYLPEDAFNRISCMGGIANLLKYNPKFQVVNGRYASIKDIVPSGAHTPAQSFNPLPTKPEFSWEKRAQELAAKESVKIKQQPGGCKETLGMEHSRLPLNPLAKEFVPIISKDRSDALNKLNPAPNLAHAPNTYEAEAPPSKTQDLNMKGGGGDDGFQLVSYRKAGQKKNSSLSSSQNLFEILTPYKPISSYYGLEKITIGGDKIRKNKSTDTNSEGGKNEPVGNSDAVRIELPATSSNGFRNVVQPSDGILGIGGPSLDNNVLLSNAALNAAHFPARPLGAHPLVAKRIMFDSAALTQSPSQSSAKMLHTTSSPRVINTAKPSPELSDVAQAMTFLGSARNGSLTLRSSCTSDFSGKDAASSSSAHSCHSLSSSGSRVSNDLTSTIMQSAHPLLTPSSKQSGKCLKTPKICLPSRGKNKVPKASHDSQQRAAATLDGIGNSTRKVMNYVICEDLESESDRSNTSGTTGHAGSKEISLVDDEYAFGRGSDCHTHSPSSVDPSMMDDEDELEKDVNCITENLPTAESGSVNPNFENDKHGTGIELDHLIDDISDVDPNEKDAFRKNYLYAANLPSAEPILMGDGEDGAFGKGTAHLSDNCSRKDGDQTSSKENSSRKESNGDGLVEKLERTFADSISGLTGPAKSDIRQANVTEDEQLTFEKEEEKKGSEATSLSYSDWLRSFHFPDADSDTSRLPYLSRPLDLGAKLSDPGIWADPFNETLKSSEMITLQKSRLNPSASSFNLPVNLPDPLLNNSAGPTQTQNNESSKHLHGIEHGQSSSTFENVPKLEGYSMRKQLYPEKTIQNSSSSSLNSQSDKGVWVPKSSPYSFLEKDYALSTFKDNGFSWIDSEINSPDQVKEQFNLEALKISTFSKIPKRPPAVTSVTVKKDGTFLDRCPTADQVTNADKSTQCAAPTLCNVGTTTDLTTHLLETLYQNQRDLLVNLDQTRAKSEEAHRAGKAAQREFEMQLSNRYKAVKALQEQVQVSMIKNQKAEERVEKMQQKLEREVKKNDLYKQVLKWEIMEKKKEKEELQTLKLKNTETMIQVIRYSAHASCLNIDIARNKATFHLNAISSRIERVKTKGCDVPHYLSETHEKLVIFDQGCEQLRNQALDELEKKTLLLQKGADPDKVLPVIISPPPFPSPPAIYQKDKLCTFSNSAKLPKEGTAVRISNLTINATHLASQSVLSSPDKPQKIKGLSPQPASHYKPHPVKPSQGPSNTISSQATKLEQQNSVFDRIVGIVQETFPDHTHAQILTIVAEIRKENRGSLIGWSFQHLIQRILDKLLDQSKEEAHENNGTDFPLNVSASKKLQDSICSVCQDYVNSATAETLECNHRFHKQCLLKWLRTDRSCPNCRKLVLLSTEFPSLHHS